MDDEDTGQRRRAIWGDGERSSTASERRARARGRQGDGVPILTDSVERELGGSGELGGVEVTKPWALLDREELNADELEIVKRSKRDSSDPVVYADLVKVISRAMKKELDERSAAKHQADHMLELLRHPPHEAVKDLQVRMPVVERQLEKVSDKISTATKVVGAAIVIALGALGYVVSVLWAGGKFEGEIRARMDHVEKAVDRPQRSDSPADRLWLAPAATPQTKDKP